MALAAVVAGSAALAWQADRAHREAANATQLKDYLIEILRQYDGQNATSKASALRSLDAAAQRMQGLTPDSRTRLELLCVLLDMYAERDLDEEGLAIAAKELPTEPVWRHDDSDPIRLRAYALAAWLRKEAGATAQARAELQRAMRTYPEPHDAAYAEAMKIVGESWADEKNYQAAAQWQLAAMHLFEKATTPVDPRLLYSRTLAGTYLTSLRQGRKGRALVERALADLPPGDSKVRVYLCAIGAIHRELFGEFESARELLLENQAVVQRLGYTRMPEFYASLRLENAFSTGRFADARAAIDKAMASVQEDENSDRLAAIYAWRGEISFAQGDTAAAAADFSAAATTLETNHPHSTASVHARAMQAISLVAAGRIDAARDALPSASGISDRYAIVAAHAARGSLLNAEGRHDDALVAYQQARDELDAEQAQPAGIRDQLRENRDAVRVRVWQAQAELAAGRTDLARATAREARELGLATLGAQHPFMRELEKVDAALALPASE